MLRVTLGDRFKVDLLLLFMLLFTLLSSFTPNSGLVAAGKSKGSKNHLKQLVTHNEPRKCYSMKMSVMQTIKEGVTDSQSCERQCLIRYNNWRDYLGHHLVGTNKCLKTRPCLDGRTFLAEIGLNAGTMSGACQSSSCPLLLCSCFTQAMFWRIKQPESFRLKAFEIRKEAAFGDPDKFYDELRDVNNNKRYFTCMPKFLIPAMLEYAPSATWLRRPNAIFTTETDLSCDEPTADERNCGCQKALGRDDRNCEASKAFPHPFDLNQPAPEFDQIDLNFAAHFDRVRESTAVTQQIDTQLRAALHHENDPNGHQDYPYSRDSLQSMQQYAPQTGSDSSYRPAAHSNSHVGYNSAPGQQSSGYGNDPHINHPEYSHQGQSSGRNGNPYQDVLPDLHAAFNSHHQQSPDCYQGPNGGVNCAFE